MPLELRFRYLKHLSGYDDYPHQHCCRWDVKSYLESAAVDILQPDVCHAGGISETRRIAVMCEAYDVALAPHFPLGPIALVVCIQVDAVSANFTIQEMSLGIHYNAGSKDLTSYLRNSEVWDVKGE